MIGDVPGMYWVVVMIMGEVEVVTIIILVVVATTMDGIVIGHAGPRDGMRTWEVPRMAARTTTM